VLLGSLDNSGTSGHPHAGPHLDNSKDLAVAIIGAAVSLAGLLLVFCGFLFSQAESFPPETTDDKTIGRYKWAAKVGLVPVLACLLVAWLGAAWLRQPSQALLDAAWWGFSASLCVVGVYGGYVIHRYL